MTTTFTIKQNDLEPALSVVLRDGAAAKDLTTALGARFLARGADGTLKIDATMSILDQTATPGGIEYAWQSGDTDTVAKYKCEIEVMWPGNRPETFPNEGYFILKITDDLG